ncbi:MAG: MFS transporter [Spirochaetales bacterium]|nr:MFS transporter [Spirochaetales bacterium]
MKNTEKQLSTLKKVVYGSGEFFGGTATVIVLSIFHKFLVEYAGLTPFLAGVAVFAGRFWDAVTDPLMGTISDKTRTRFGRRRPYFLIFSVPASLLFLLLWIPVVLNGMIYKVIYYSMAYMLFSTFYTMLNTPWLALGPELTSDYNERTNIVTIRMVFSLLGSLFAGTVPNILIQNFPDSGYLIMSGILGLIYVVIWMSMFFFMEEKPVDSTHQEMPFLTSFKMAMKNKSFQRLLGMYVAIFLAIDFVVASPRYLAEELFQRPFLVQLMMGILIFGMLAGLPLFTFLTKKMGRKHALTAGALVWMAMLLFFFILPRDISLFLLLPIIAVMGMAMSAAFVVPWSALPETIDVDRLVNGRNSEGIYAGIMTFTRKLISSTVVLIIGASLSLAGYVSNIPDSLRAEDRDRIVSVLGTEAADPVEAAYPDRSGGVYPKDENLSKNQNINALNALKKAGYITQPENVLFAIRVNTAGYPILLLILAMIFSITYPVRKRHHDLMRRKLEGTEKDQLSEEEEEELKGFLRKAYLT